MADCKNRCSACIWTMQRPRICPSCVSSGWVGSTCVLLLFSYLPRWWPKEVGWCHDTVSPHVYHPKAASLWQGHPVSVERPCTPARGHSQLPGATGAMAQWANRKESGSFPFTSSKVTYMYLGKFKCINSLSNITLIQYNRQILIMCKIAPGATCLLTMPHIFFTWKI